MLGQSAARRRRYRPRTAVACRPEGCDGVTHGTSLTPREPLGDRLVPAAAASSRLMDRTSGRGVGLRAESNPLTNRAYMKRMLARDMVNIHRIFAG